MGMHVAHGRSSVTTILVRMCALRVPFLVYHNVAEYYKSNKAHNKIVLHMPNLQVKPTVKQRRTSCV